MHSVMQQEQLPGHTHGRGRVRGEAAWCGEVAWVPGRGATRFFFASCRLSSSLSSAISCGAGPHKAGLGATLRHCGEAGRGEETAERPGGTGWALPGLPIPWLGPVRAELHLPLRQHR